MKKNERNINVMGIYYSDIILHLGMWVVTYAANIQGVLEDWFFRPIWGFGMEIWQNFRLKN